MAAVEQSAAALFLRPDRPDWPGPPDRPEL